MAPTHSATQGLLLPGSCLLWALAAGHHDYHLLNPGITVMLRASARVLSTTLLVLEIPEALFLRDPERALLQKKIKYNKIKEQRNRPRSSEVPSEWLSSVHS